MYCDVCFPYFYHFTSNDTSVDLLLLLKNLISTFPAILNSLLLLFPFFLLDAVKQTAGDEGHRHEEDYAWTHKGCHHSHAVTKIIGRQSWRVTEEEPVDWCIDWFLPHALSVLFLFFTIPFIILQNLCITTTRSLKCHLTQGLQILSTSQTAVICHKCFIVIIQQRLAEIKSHFATKCSCQLITERTIKYKFIIILFLSVSLRKFHLSHGDWF